MDALARLIEEKLKNPIGLLFAIFTSIATILTSCVGLYEFFQKIPYPWNWILVIVILFSIISAIVIFFMMVGYSRRYNIPLEDRYLFKEVLQKCYIDSEGLRHFNQQKTYFFFREPRKDDFFDNQLSSKKLPFQEMNYKSSDSRIVSIDDLPEKNLCKIYWEPVEDNIKIGVPYTHEFSCTYPAQKIDEFENVNWITISTSCYISKYKIIISSDKEIESVVTFKKRWGQSLKNPKKIIKFSKIVQQTFAPPVVMKDNILEWEHEELKRGDMFFIVIFYKHNNGI